MDIRSIINAILDGDIDGSEDAVYDAIKQRRRLLEMKKGTELRKYDSVVFNDSARPKYLKGTVCEVVKTNTTTVGIRIPSDGVKGDFGGRFVPGSVVNAPLSIVDKINRTEV